LLLISFYDMFSEPMSYSVDIYDKTGKVVSKISLCEDVFADEKINHSLIHEYYLLQTSNARIARAHTKTRGEVTGSGKKLYRQKGTGRARAGDVKSPVRRWWWVVFGPSKERNFTKDMPKKARKRALYGLLTLKIKDGEIYGFVGFDIKEPKTKDASTLLSKIGLDKGKVLIVVEQKNDTITKSFRNLEKVKYVLVDYLNPYDLLNYPKILFTQAALERLNTKEENK